MEAIVQDWLSLALRWAHIIAGISWIGSSFYFMWLDSSLKRRAGMSEGIKGENWTVHGGGFYHTQKYMVAPDAMPGDLHWFRWESYATWLSGFCLLVVMYYWSASSYLIDKSVADIPPMQAITISVLGLGLGWLFYDRLCESALRHRPVLLFGLLFVGLIVATWGYSQVFSARAAFIQVGATIATWMSGNVFLVIIPNQRIVVADLKAGRVPDGKYGAIAKLRSTHNNYLTLPVVFLMISNHYPITFGHPWNWGVVAFVLALGVVIRDWFNKHESGAHGNAVMWQWPAAAALFIGMVAFTAWKPGGAAFVEGEVSAPEAMQIVEAHCTTCHAAAPSHEAFDAPPGGVVLETPEHIQTHRAKVLAQAVMTNAMPLGNETGMTSEERVRLGAFLNAN